VPADASGFILSGGATVTSVAQGSTSSNLVLTTTGLTVGGSFTLTVNGVESLAGTPIAADTQANVDFTLQVPLEFGQAVTGLQDSFDEATLSTNWVPVPSDNNPFTQSGGMLHMQTLTNITDEALVHLFYEPPSGYSSDDQEVLIHMRINSWSAGAVGGASVAGDPQYNDGYAANMVMADPGADLVIDGSRGGLSVSGFAWQTNTWYWLRLSMPVAAPPAETYNLLGKVWLGDGTTPEPLDWQVQLAVDMNDGDPLFAGLEAPGNGIPASFDVDYFLLETPDLPSITVTPDAFPLSSAVFLNITNQPLSEFVPPGQTATFTANAVAWAPVSVQWQVAPPNSTVFANIQDATNTTLTISNVLEPVNSNQYQAVFTAPDITATSLTAVLTTEASPPELVFARTGGSNGQVIVQFSQSIVAPVVTNFSINNGVTVTGITAGPTNTEVILSVTPLSLNSSYILTVSGISNNYGNVLISAQTSIDFNVYLPAEFGTMVSGFQDDFTEATLSTNWLIYTATAGGSLNWPPPSDMSTLLTLTNGNLYIGVDSDGTAYNPFHVVYAPTTPYNATNQEILARVMVTSTDPGPYDAIGVCVCASPSNARGIGWYMGDGGLPNALESPGCEFLDDYTAWGPAEYYSWVFNTWYWLRESELNGTTYGKIWLADGATPEPAGWDISWQGNAFEGGYAGFSPANGGGYAFWQVSYALIEASGLPAVQAQAPSLYPFAYPPGTLNLSITSPGQFALQWGGDATATLQTAPAVNGPWTSVEGATSPYNFSSSSEAAFFRVKE
jgi:hypothetical protein